MAQTVVNQEQAVKDKDGYAGYTFRLEVIMNSYNSDNATYNVTINHYAKGDNATNHKYHGLTTPKSTITAVANGSTVVNDVAVVGQITGSEVNVHSWTGNIQANNDGTLSIKYSANYNANKSSGYLPQTNTIELTISMPQIPRASSFTVSGTILGSATTVSISRASSSFTHRVKYVMGNITENYTDVGTSKQFTRPYTDAQQFGATAVSGTGTITVITYSGSTEIGRVSQSINMSLPDNNDTKPASNTATAISDNMTAIATKFGAFIQTKSRPKFVFDYSAKYGANISQYSLVIDNKTYTSSSATIILDAIQTSGTKSYTATIKDSRGRTKTETGSISITAYNQPQISLNVERDNTGLNAVVNVNASITSLNNLNDKAVVIKYKVHSASTYQTTTVAFDSGTYSMNKTVNISIDDDKSYDFYATATDYFGSVDTSTLEISTVFDLLHFGADGESLGLGKKVENNGAFEIGLDTYYKGNKLEDNLPKVSTQVDDDFRVNILKSKNILNHYIPSSAVVGLTRSMSGSELLFNGTTTNAGSIYKDTSNKFTLKAGSYKFIVTKLSGAFTRTSQDTAIYVRKVSDNSTITQSTGAHNYEQNEQFTLTADTAVHIEIYCNGSGMVFNNLKLGIMITPYTPDTTYEPYVTPTINVDGEEICGKKSAIMCSLSSDYTTTTYTALEKLTLDTVITNVGNKFTLSSGEILIGDNVDAIKVSAQVYFADTDMNGQRLLLLIQKSGTNIAQCERVGRGVYETISQPTVLTKVSAGDKIKLLAGSYTASGKKVKGNYRTFITVEEL